MWLAIKEAARKDQRNTTPKVPSLDVRKRELGSVEDAIRYGKLFDAHPDVPLGPDEDIQHHYNRLNAAEQEYQQAGNPEQMRRAQDPRLKSNRPAEVPKSDASWVTAPLPTDLKGMPQRIPGWFTGDAIDKPPRDFIPGAGPLPERKPGRSFGWSPYDGPEPRYQPPQQSHEDWVKWLADKGIQLDQNGQRVVPERPMLPRGHDIWSDLIDRPQPVGRHRAAQVVVAYVKSRLATEHVPDPNYMDDPAYAAWFNRHDRMRRDNWNLVESGSGNYWHKQIGDKHHFIVGEPGGWTHYISNSPGYYGGSRGYGPYQDIDEAVLNSKIGPLVPMGSPKPRDIEDSSYHPERSGGRTDEMVMLPEGPSIRGKFQTLNSTSWSDEG